MNIQSATASPAAASLGRALQDVLTDVHSADPAEQWRRLAHDGWQLAGMDEHGAPIAAVDVCHLAEVAGRALCASPLVTTLLVQRWGAADDEAPDAPWSVVLPAGPGRVSVRHAAFAGLALYGAVELPAAGLKPLDTFAPTMPFARVDGRCGLTGEQLAEARGAGVAEALGAAQGAFDEALAYAKQRKQFGRPIGSFQAVQHHFANMHRDLEFGRALVLHTLTSNGTAQWHAAVQGLDRARSVVETALQTFGGISFTAELGLDRWLRHVIALSDVYGRNLVA